MATATARLTTTLSFGIADISAPPRSGLRDHSKIITHTDYDTAADALAAYGRYVEEQRATLCNHTILKEEEGTAGFGASVRRADGKILAAATRVVTWDGSWTDHEALDWSGDEPEWVITEGSYNPGCDCGEADLHAPGHGGSAD